MAFYAPMVLPMHVLLVDNDLEKLYETCRLLEFNSYRVTATQDYSSASSMLSKQKTVFDLVMIDISSSNLEGYKLLHQAVNMGITATLMSTNASTTLVKCAIEDGAFLFMEKPIDVGEVRYLWQHVLREKTRKSRENLRFISSTVNQCPSVNKETPHREAREGLSLMNSPENETSDSIARSKFCTSWTPELHEKFRASVKQLGEGRCFPKDILELMNVPGLTRMQVASHLQKCRYGWQPPHERQSRKQKAPRSASSSSNHSRRYKAKRRYGLFPHLAESSQMNEQCPIEPTTNNQNLNNTIDINFGIQGALNNNFIPNMNEIPNEVVLGTAPNQGLQVPCDFLPNDDALIAHNPDLPDPGYGNIISDGKTPDGNDNQNEAEFWTSWIADFARE